MITVRRPNCARSHGLETNPSVERSAITLFAIALSLLLQADGFAESSERPPNIVFMFADDLGYA
ncbi:MAG: hypothetical protein AAGC97_11630, partial [Planctomycetota bacterium]